MNKDVERVLKEFHQAGKPIGYVRPSGPGSGGGRAVAEPVSEAVAHSQEMAPGAVWSWRLSALFLVITEGVSCDLTGAFQL